MGNVEAVSLLDTALGHVRRGLAIFPCNGKTPATAHGFEDASKDPGQIERWFAHGFRGNVGTATGAVSGLFVLDVDPKHGGDESIAELQRKHGPLPDTWESLTGGGGIHWFFKHPGGGIPNSAGKLGPGLDIRGDGGYVILPGSVHPDTGRTYDWEASHHPDDIPLGDAPEWLLALVRDSAHKAADTMPEKVGEGARNATLFSLAGSMRRRGASENAILAAISEENALRCVPPLADEEVKAIAKSAARYEPNGLRNHVCMYIPNATEKSGYERNTNATDTQQSLSKRVEEWVRGTTGAWWATEELDRDLSITDKKDKNNRREILLRLREQGVIEQHGKINKQFRFINTRVAAINFKNATRTGAMAFNWPLGVEKYVNLFPGNMAVVAGAPNAGKTALMLNLVHLNQDAFAIYYWCSEMGDVELRDRLDKFPGIDIEDWHFEAKERSKDFADVIVPDAVNIIDFLEMTTELYEVNNMLTAIAHKVGTGLAIVALQKKIGAAMGRGAEFGLEKPKLYLSMDRGLLRIVKGKSWAVKNVDPNGRQVHFKIVDGCQFVATDEWDWPKQG